MGCLHFSKNNDEHLRSFWPLRIWLCLLLGSNYLFQLCDATVTLVESREFRKYSSTPAAFGLKLESGYEYEGRLQVLEDDPFLCNSDKDGKDHTIVFPRDGLPVVLLAEKGGCSYEEKARTAMSISKANRGVVQYVIVYDDKNGSTKLETMTSPDPDGISVALLFVTNASGKDMLLRILEQSSASRDAGGVPVLMDAFTPWFPSLSTGEWFALFTCLGVILVVINIKLFAPDDVDRAIFEAGPDGAGQSANNFLTREQVLELPEYQYNSKDPPDEEKGLMLDGGEDEDKDINGNDADSIHSSLMFESGSCSICLEDYNNEDILRVLPCKHPFHSDCILPWLTERSPNCPLCKERVSLESASDMIDDTVADISPETDGATGDSEEAATSSHSSILRLWPWARRSNAVSADIDENDGNQLEEPLLNSDATII
eukprot:CAMPEP_0194377616 /NCGR_PEP_ID=MMETSP0174-20130528/32156_1 /TAXON_ID=216777 /ORGANISM="Proboscia alata, Strain PI-D3" /LENGTH=429 /DNA_ID=CAMNT_0039159101 /DNA_START=97 /DNA_END=1386 /DNA_ORIENTATION=+